MTARARSIVIHGHFYQPPREDPWFEEVPTEPTAAPLHDWNERIERECYAAIVSAPLVGDEEVRGHLNALSGLSFDFGPTLLEWLERKAPNTYAAILRADRWSRRQNGGYGNAVAAPYHHVILPLCSRRDKQTEVRWGIADFRRRFRRDPVGFWLPEAAVDDETLDVLAAEGIAFTILSPQQVLKPPERGMPALYRTGGGRTIALFLYDGPLSHAVAFGPLVGQPEAWVERMAGVPGDGCGPEPCLVAVATDGETYGHHHEDGEVGLAAVLEELGRRTDTRLENFASFLARHHPREEAELVEPSSWSCPHGVDRWRTDCGCRLALDSNSHQRWREPLRDALEWLAVELDAAFERDGSRLFGNPWRGRDRYGEVLAGSPAEIGLFAPQWAEGAGRVRALELLELERHALGAFTSCAWFFDDLAGLEGTQVLRYAARAIDLAEPRVERLEGGLLERLSAAPVNDPDFRDGAELYRARAKPRIPPPIAAAAAYAVARHLGIEAETLGPRGYRLARPPEGDGDGSITMVEARTGRLHAARTRVEEPLTDGLAVVVEARESSAGTEDPSDTEGQAQRVELRDLPERLRAAIADRLAGIDSDLPHAGGAPA